MLRRRIGQESFRFGDVGGCIMAEREPPISGAGDQ